MSDVTLSSLKMQLSDYYISRMKTMTANKNYISSNEFRAELTNYYKTLLSTGEAALSSTQQAELKSYCESYVETAMKAYDRNLEFNSVSSSTAAALDTDPIIRNGKTYIHGDKKLQVFSDYLGTNSTYSMCDMVAILQMETDEGYISTNLGELQTISYSIHQEKMPVRCLGNMNPKDWVFGPRTIAGSLVFAVFNKHWLINTYDTIKKKANMKNWHFISDEIPPFNIICTFANEYGFDSKLVLYGVRLMNEGQVMSVNDIYIENTYEFVAVDIELLDSLADYQQNMSKHIRGSNIATEITNDTNHTDNSNPNPIDTNNSSQNNNNSVTRTFNAADLTFPESYLEKTDKSVALKDLKDIYNALIEEFKDNKEVKTEIKLVYKEQKNRLKQYYAKQKKESKN